MGQITLTYEDSKRILDNPEASPDARVIAAGCIAFFEANNHADVVTPKTKAIAWKLARMLGSALDGDGE